MRFLRNPIVTGILTLLAVGMVFYQFVVPYLLNNSPPRTGKAVPATTPAAEHAIATAKELREQLTLAAAPSRGPTIDRDYVESRFAKWVASPGRDPFLLLGAEPKEKDFMEMFEPSPIAKWKLNAIWDQTGSRLAVINNAVHQVGDDIAGYKIIRIDSQEVWFQGPRRKERLGLASKGPAVLPNPTFIPATKLVPSSTVPQ